MLFKPSSLSNARRAKHAFENTKKGREQFLAGTFELARILSTERKKLPSDQAFSAWLAKAGLSASISKDDRAALIFIGQHVKEARKFYETQDDRWSWRSCRSDVASQLAIAAMRNTDIQVTQTEPVTVQLHVTNAPAVSQAAKPTGQLLVASQPQKQQLEPPEFVSKPEDGGVAAVLDIVAASSLATESVARRFTETMPLEARPSPDQICDAGHWLILLARTLKNDEDKRPMH
jgi:hypothetical protein